MTHEQTTSASVEVTQADREAAMARDVSRGYTQRTRAKVLRGDKDEDELVQAFARHRIAHPAPPADLVELVEVCQRILDRGYISASIAEERDDYIALHNALAKHGGA